MADKTIINEPEEACVSWGNGVSVDGNGINVDGVRSSDSNIHRLDPGPRVSSASYSLGRLEHDLKKLQAKWRAVEGDISERDHHIAQLQAELSELQKQYGALETERRELVEKKAQLESKLSEQNESVIETSDRVDDLLTQNAELRKRLQELEDYIDRRKIAWNDLNARLQGYEDTIAGMSSALGSHDELVAQKEDEKALLALKVMELERELAEMKGRYVEGETRQAKLQETVEDQSRELGSRGGETKRLSKEIDRQQKKLDRRDSTVRALKKQLKERSQDSSSGDEEAIGALQKNLDAANRRAADLESEVAQCVQKLEEMTTRASQFETRSAELYASLLESSSVQNEIEQELEAQRELVRVLENELSDKQQNLDVLDRSAARLSAIGSGIRDLDVRIDDRWFGQPGTKQSEITRDADGVMIPAEEPLSGYLVVYDQYSYGGPTHHPLNGHEITIGRSRRSDVHLNSKYVSRIHARITVDGSVATIEDAGSANGFLVNDVPTRRHELCDGDNLEIGDTRIRYVKTVPAG